MLRIKKIITFILCVTLLIPLFGCSSAESTVIESASVPENSKPSAPIFDTEPPVMESEEEKIDYTNRKPAYSIEPLEEPKNGAMTYEEFFSEERFVQLLGKVFIDNFPDEIKNNSDWKYTFKDKGEEPYVVDIGDGYIVPLNQSEIWWYSYDFSEKKLIRRVAEYDSISRLDAYDDILVWIERDNWTTRTYRLYLPTMEMEEIAQHSLSLLNVTKDYGRTQEGFSTDVFSLDNFRHYGGIMVFCHSDNAFYFVKVNDMVNGWDLWPNLQEMKEKLNA